MHPMKQERDTLNNTQVELPRVIISALKGGAGKTVISIGVTAKWRQNGFDVTPFKKGPDYIDAGWLALAASQPCHNLDLFLFSPEKNFSSFYSNAIKGEISLIEGNRGLFDGIDEEGATSTAELSKILNAPVILTVDCTKTTRTMAAVILGCQTFDPNVSIKGVILNKVAGKRHEGVLTKNIERYCGIPVVGAIPKLGEQYFPERHMGLVPREEHGWAFNAVDKACEIIKKYVDHENILSIAKAASPLSDNTHDETIVVRSECNENADIIISDISTSIEITSSPLRIGVIKDSAFQFYYPENFKALENAGAELVFTSPLMDNEFPEGLCALYIGGGFPETHAELLEKNKTYRERIKSLAHDNFPIYAECGGLMYLGKSLALSDKTYEMAGVLPIVYGLSKKPIGHGYAIVEVLKDTPYYTKGEVIKGHEFHYSMVTEYGWNDEELTFSMQRGTGFLNRKDGVSYKNVLASYTHIHAYGMPQWAKRFVALARQYQNSTD